MEALDVILTRRSVRKYSTASVPQESVDLLLRAAMAAPSAGDQRPWRFVVVKDKDRLQELAAAEPHGGMIARAALAVVVCADLGRVRHDGFWVQDCSAATENLLLAAHALGLGAVWVGTYPRDDRVRSVGEVLGLRDPLLAFAVVAIGYPEESTASVDRFDPERVYVDRYEERV
jgi:nitroreductase